MPSPIGNGAPTLSYTDMIIVLVLIIVCFTLLYCFIKCCFKIHDHLASPNRLHQTFGGESADFPVNDRPPPYSLFRYSLRRGRGRCRPAPSPVSPKTFAIHGAQHFHPPLIWITSRSNHALSSPSMHIPSVPSQISLACSTDDKAQPPSYEEALRICQIAQLQQDMDKTIANSENVLTQHDSVKAIDNLDVERALPLVSSCPGMDVTQVEICNDIEPSRDLEISSCSSTADDNPISSPRSASCGDVRSPKITDTNAAKISSDIIDGNVPTKTCASGTSATETTNQCRDVFAKF